VQVWKIRRFTGSEEHTLRSVVGLVSTTKERKPWARPPISMQFTVPMFSASGLRVQYLKILERKLGSTYKVERWVRKICKSGDYMTRI
jgi:AP-2 complex subunit mu-1